MQKIDQIKQEQSNEVEMWNSKVQEIEEKIKDIDEMILQPR